MPMNQYIHLGLNCPKNRKDNLHAIAISTNNGLLDLEPINASVDQLEDVFTKYLLLPVEVDDDSDYDQDDVTWPVQHFTSQDSHLLKSKGTKENPYVKIRMYEQQNHEEADGLYENMLGLETGTAINLKLFEASSDLIRLNDNNYSEFKSNGNNYDGDWTCVKHHASIDYDDKAKGRTNIKIVDITPFQNSNENNNLVSLHKPGVIFHLLRSILTCESQNSHITSPWKAAYSNVRHQNNACNGMNCGDCPYNCTIGIILRDSFFSQPDRMVIEEVVKFRVGDVSPSFYLHSTIRLTFSSNQSISEQIKEALESDIDNAFEIGEEDAQDVILLVYRHVPPRTHLTAKVPIDKDDLIVGDDNHDSSLCLWEAFIPEAKINDESKDEEKILANTLPLAPTIYYRQVSSPYHSLETIYPDIPISSSLLNANNLAIMIQEAISIPQWTAWPERQHYSSSSNDDDDDDDESPSWTVFPICHTFPANDITRRKFIPSTCAYVPQTASLLKRYLGDALRTALFSRLKPETTLAPHTGWSDLANHVFRLHIPLVVPDGGYCGTWVDGCVEEQRVGKVICFDDSKVHRAFNYSEEERIVLIVDLIRNVGGRENVGKRIPLGTATGGHSDELDAFIDQLS